MLMAQQLSFRLLRGNKSMARCTAPVRGHSSAAAAAACPACRNRSGYRRSSYSYDSYPSYSSGSSGGGSYGGSSGGSSSSAKPRWSKSGSSVSYTTAQVQSLTPIRQAVEKLAIEQPDLRDVFLCHAWDDRQGIAKELHDLLEAAGVKVWFSEKDLALGVPMMRAIDKGLANSRIGLVLVTPALLNRLPKEGVADKNFPPYWQATNSFPSCITRRMKLSVMSVLCLHPEAASTREKIHWQLLQQKLQS